MAIAELEKGILCCQNWRLCFCGSPEVPEPGPGAQGISGTDIHCNDTNCGITDVASAKCERKLPGNTGWGIQELHAFDKFSL